MRWLFVPLVGLVVVAGAMSLSACALTCRATPDKLAHLRRDMSYAETVAVMGCPGYVVSPYGPESSDYATVEWNGPASSFLQRTQIDFQDGKLLSYTTVRRGAL